MYFRLFTLLLVTLGFCRGTVGIGNKKIIALTFDDGPRPYVLFGSKSSPVGLLDLLERNNVKATFFVMGWRLANTDCRLAAEEIHRHGHEIENHTFGHGFFRAMKQRFGEEWILKDIDRASILIKSVTGAFPKYVRPPGWVIWQDLRKRIESRGYRVMVKSAGDISEPLLTRDVDSEDYFCASPSLSKCPKPSLEISLLRKIEERERKGVYGHILVFHELPVSVKTLAALIPKLKAQGYVFVRLDEYFETTKRR